MMVQRDPFAHVAGLERVPKSARRHLVSRLRELLDEYPDGLLTYRGPVRGRPGGHLVRDLVPASCPAFARLLHPIQGDSRYGDEHGRVRWAEVARLRSFQLDRTTLLAGLLQPDEALLPGEPPPEPLIGELDHVTVRDLVPILERHARSPRTFFLYWSGISEIGNDNGDTVYVGPLRLVEELFPYGGLAFLSPNFWWDEAETWFIATQTDAMSTYLGGPAALVREVCASPNFEAFEVSPDDPFDDCWMVLPDTY